MYIEYYVSLHKIYWIIFSFKKFHFIKWKPTIKVSIFPKFYDKIFNLIWAQNWLGVIISQKLIFKFQNLIQSVLGISQIIYTWGSMLLHTINDEERIRKMSWI